MGFVIAVLVNAAALWVAVTVLDGIHYEGEWYQWLILGLIFGVVNAIVKPILALLTFPITIVTLGLFLIVLNAIMLWLTDWIADWFDSLVFEVDHFWWDAIWGALIISVVSWIIGLFVKPERVARRVAR